MSLPPFDRVVTDHAAVVLRVCRAMLPHYDAEDAAADAFLAALEAYPRLRPGSDIRAWLVTIAHRKAIDVTRRRSRQAVPVESLPDIPATAQLDLPDERLWTALRALPDKQRHAVAYHYLADLPYAQVAMIMEISEVAARRNAADGVRTLRNTFASAPSGASAPSSQERTP